MWDIEGFLAAIETFLDDLIGLLSVFVDAILGSFMVS
jgi:hypothetical protein